MQPRQAVLDHIARVVSSKRTLWGRPVSNLDNLFDAIDADQTGYINVSELKRAFVRLGIMVKSGKGKKAHRANKGIEDLLKSMDSGRDGKIDRSEFVTALTPYGIKRGKAQTNHKHLFHHLK